MREKMRREKIVIRDNSEKMIEIEIKLHNRYDLHFFVKNEREMIKKVLKCLSKVALEKEIEKLEQEPDAEDTE